MKERLTYRFGPLERRGLLGPMRAGQAALLAAGMLGAVALIDAAPDAQGALLATAVLAGVAALLVIPLGHRGLDEWIPVTALFALRAISGRRTFRSPLPTSGVSVEAGSREMPRATVSACPRAARRMPRAGVHPPRTLQGLRILSHGKREAAMGVAVTRDGRRLSATLACRALGFGLLDPEAQERRLARWGQLLAGAAGGPIRRIQWLERTSPAQGDELAKWVHDERDPAIPLRGTAMIDSYLELIATTTRVSHEHEILVALQVDAQHSRRGGVASGMDLLQEQVERVALGLEGAEVAVLGALTESQLARALRCAFDPYARAELAALEAADPGRAGAGEANAWPLATRESWDTYRADGALHSTYWIGSWPRVEVTPMFLDPILGPSGAVRTVAVVLEPLSPRRSTREAEAAITRHHADRELRRRFGQSETARQRQSEEATARREAELAAGHAEVRMAGFVTVSGRDEAELRRACTEVGEQAARARLELHCMYGQQADAFTFTLPLCRGLR